MLQPFTVQHQHAQSENLLTTLAPLGVLLMTAGLRQVDG